MEKIVTLTMNPAIDISVVIPRVTVDRKLRAKNVSRYPGGGGINVSRAISELGGESLACYVAGGYTGRLLDELMEGEGIETVSIPLKQETRQNFVINEESSEQQYHLCMPGPQLTEEEYEQVLERISGIEAGFLVASGSLPPGVPVDFYSRLVRQARDRGVKTIIDSQGDALSAAAKEGVYLLKPNMRELADLEGAEIKDSDQLDRAARKLVEGESCEILVLSLGKGGATLFREDGKGHFPTPTVPVNSAVGSGDSMVAGMVYSLAKGRAVEEAIRLGVCAGAAAVMTPGTELCRRKDVRRLYEQDPMAEDRLPG